MRVFKKFINSDSNLRELLSGSFISFTFKMLGMLLSYGIIFFISKKLGAEGAGIYSLSFNLLNALAIVGTLGTNVSILRYSGEYNATNNKLLKSVYKYSFLLTLFFSILIGITIYYTSSYISLNILKNEKYTDILKIVAFAIPVFSISLINVEFIRGIKKLKISEYFRGANNYLIILILMIVFEMTIFNTVVSLFIAICITFFITSIYIVNYLKKIKSYTEESIFKIKTLVVTSLPMMMVSISSILLGVSGAFILEAYSTSEEVGVFNVCAKIAQLVSIVLLVVNTVAAPKFSELFWQNKRKELQKILTQSSKLIFLCSLVLSILLMVFSSQILGFFGEEFVTGTVILIILVLGQLINSISGSVGIFLNMTGHEKVLKNILVISTIIVVIANFLVVPLYGALGAAIVTFLGTCLVNLPAVIFAKKRLNYITYFSPFKSNNE